MHIGRNHPKTKALLGLAIHDTQVQLLGLNQEGTSPHITAFGMATLAPGIFDGYEIKDSQALSQSIRLAHKQSQSKIKHIATAIPTTRTISRFIHLPRALTADALHAHVLLEASKCLPPPLSELAVDYQRVDDTSDNRSEQTLLLMCTKQNYVDNLINVIHHAGLVPIIIDVDVLAMSRACTRLFPLLKLHSQQLIAFFEMTSTKMRFFALTQHRVVWTHEEALDMSAITQTQDSSHHHNNIATFISRSLQQLENQQKRTMDIIFILSEKSNNDELIYLINQITPTSVMDIDPLLDMTLSKHVALHPHPINLTQVCGLALRGVHDYMH